MKLQAATLRPSKKSARSGRQEGLDRLFFGFFRDQSKRPEVKRVERILSLMVAAQTNLDEVRRLLRSSDNAGSIPEFLDLHERQTASERAYYKALEQLQTALTRYRWRSSVSGDLDGFTEELEWGIEVASGYPTWEYAAVRLLLREMKKAGSVSRFRKCSECRQWFYAATSHQQFCKDACRRRYTSESPEFKEKRRIYMREQYRPQQKEMQQRSLAAVKTTHHTKGKG